MKILLTSIGTLGDMEPFLSIGEMCKKSGCQVICAFPEQFRNVAEDADLEFASLGSEFIEMLESDIGKKAIGGEGSGFKKIWAFVQLAKMQGEINKGLLRKQFEIIAAEKPDRVVHNGKAMYPVIWEVNNPGKTTYVSPVPYLHYVHNNTHVAFNSNYGTFLNRLTFKLADWGLVKTIMTSIKWLKINNVSKTQIQQVLKTHKIIYTISPSLFPKPDYWPANMKVMGYHERNLSANWIPDQELLHFINRHPKILFITFGSMMNPNPMEKTKVIIEILERNNIPAIINLAAGGLVRPSQHNKELIHFVSKIPYSWIFPKVYGVIHHGGSGTTHMALRNGCATLIIPHIIDQFVWNKIIYQKKAGPKGVKIGKIRVDNLEPPIIELYNNSSYKKNAEKIKLKMELEDFEAELIETILRNTV